ncbi:MAG: phosphatase PAP2 family protein [Deltaproteobacteria bacterium]|nr:phosphatase PAP2 family protein [Deltaproteobacteria bacterium]
MAKVFDIQRAIQLLVRALFYYVFFCIVNVQVLFVVMRVPGVDFDGSKAVWANCGVIPVALMVWRLWAERARPLPPLQPWYRGWVLGIAMFGFWSLSYLLIGALVRPERVTQLAFEVDRAIPFDPGWVFVYLCVYPMFLLPFLHDAPPGTHRRLALGYILVLLVAYAVFLSVPVGFARSDMPVGAKQYAVWALGKVHVFDRPWNCLPSTHCAVSLLAGLALWEMGGRIRVWGMATALGIAVSTTLTKQHYVIDVVAGYALALASYWLLRRASDAEQPVRWLRPVVDAARRVLRPD